MSQLTVATINVRNRADRWLSRRHLLVGQLVDAAPDLISLQELSFPIGQGRWLRNQINARLSGDSKRPYRLIQKRRAHPLLGYTEGIGILTKLPVLYHEHLPLGFGGRIALRINVELPTRQTVDFVNVHLHSNAFGKEERLEQVVKLTGWLHDRRWVPCQIVAGDFNEIPDGLAIKYMKQSFRSVYEIQHAHEPYATFPTALVQPKPSYEDQLNMGWTGCLDYIFVSPAIKHVQKAAIFCDKPADDDDTLYPSDHVGIVSTLAL